MQNEIEIKFLFVTFLNKNYIFCSENHHFSWHPLLENKAKTEKRWKSLQLNKGVEEKSWNLCKFSCWFSVFFWILVFEGKSWNLFLLVLEFYCKFPCGVMFSSEFLCLKFVFCLFLAGLVNCENIGFLCIFGCSDTRNKMVLIAGILMGMIFGVGLMAAWKYMTSYRSTKRSSKVWFWWIMICLNDHYHFSLVILVCLLF